MYCYDSEVIKLLQKNVKIVTLFLLIFAQFINRNSDVAFSDRWETHLEFIFQISAFRNQFGAVRLIYEREIRFPRLSRECESVEMRPKKIISVEYFKVVVVEQFERELA